MLGEVPPQPASARWVGEPRQFYSRPSQPLAAQQAWRSVEEKQRELVSKSRDLADRCPVATLEFWTCKDPGVFSQKTLEQQRGVKQQFIEILSLRDEAIDAAEIWMAQEAKNSWAFTNLPSIVKKQWQLVQNCTWDLRQHNDLLMQLTFGSHRKDHKSNLEIRDAWRKLR